MIKFKFHFLTIAILLIELQSHGQTNKVDSYDILYGTKLFKNNFYNQVNTLNKYSYSSPVQLIGIGYSGCFEVTRGSYNYVGHISYEQVIPQQLIINNTIKCNLNGFILSVSVLGWDFFPKSKNFHVLFTGGFNTGRLRLGGNELVRQKNPFFSPMISLQPKIAIGKIILSIRGDYEWDVSRKNWRRTLFANKNKINLDTYKQTGASIFFCFGFVIPETDEKKLSEKENYDD